MKIRRKIEEDIAIDMSPMIDMVFLLLIFFIVASAIVKVDPIKIDIPAAVYATVPDDETGRFKITVDSEGGMYVGADSAKPVTIDDLKEIIARELEADNLLKVVIRADLKTKYEFNEKIMIACAEVGATDMIFTAFEE
jgi:biopolymer transport protein ExbD